MTNPTFPLAIDSTVLASLRACKRQFELGTLFSYKPKGTSIHLHAGAAYAKALEVARTAFYLHGVTPESALEAGIQALIHAYGDFESGDSPKSLDRMCGALEYYLDQYPLATDPARVITLRGKPAVEFSFAIPLPITHPDTGEPLILAGRFDSIVEYASGLYANDDKTTSSLGGSWSRQWELRGQFCGYAYAMREHGLAPAGTIVTGVSILKTKYETQRAVISQPDWKINEWYEDSLGDIRDAIAIYTSGSRWRKNWSEACNGYGSCTYKQCCQVADPQPWLDTYFEIKPWNPLEHKDA